ncbi:protein-glutamate O-methyltransferase CheR [Nocardioides sp.]|uniref:CheR family methyltransferase n=1 Tax=Nocardioides sp. TaxID=35761 RepID=UPI0027360892|nr:protein-glutamate O-methyltransferase CheR [Nocardioides sp.]MDP3890233.1 protein-glutamate O-methyltransferase CheR [Nocardioides sp.]
MTISAPAFEYVSTLVRRETAVIYDLGKEYLAEARLLPLAREAGCADVDAYVARLRTDPTEHRRAVDALTINETSWFRDNAPYQVFTGQMLPALLTARATTRHLSLWSAACSSGQEAYSLAMLLDQHLPAGWTAEILATDVSTAMLDRVRAGRYGQVEMNRGLPATSLVRYFSRVGSEWEVSDDLKRMVRTQHLNLAAPFPPLPTFDVVFLRNVLIYFDLPTKRDILRRVRDRIAPDGYLLLGSSETTLDMDEHWTRELSGRVQVHRPAVAERVTTTSPRLTAATTGA